MAALVDRTLSALLDYTDVVPCASWIDDPILFALRDRKSYVVGFAVLAFIFAAAM